MVKNKPEVKIVKDNSNRILIDIGNQSEEVVQAVADHGADLITQGLEKHGKINTGLTLNEIKVVNHKDHVSIECGGAMSWIEFGRPPGIMPPVEPIQRWAELKGLIDKRKKGERGTVSSSAWAIAKGIEKNGIKPTPIVRNAVQELKVDAPKIIKEFRGG